MNKALQMHHKMFCWSAKLKISMLKRDSAIITEIPKTEEQSKVVMINKIKELHSADYTPGALHIITHLVSPRTHLTDKYIKAQRGSNSRYLG